MSRNYLLKWPTVKIFVGEYYGGEGGGGGGGGNDDFTWVFCIHFMVSNVNKDPAATDMTNSLKKSL